MVGAGTFSRTNFSNTQIYDRRCHKCSLSVHIGDTAHSLNRQVCLPHSLHQCILLFSTSPASAISSSSLAITPFSTSPASAISSSSLAVTPLSTFRSSAFSSSELSAGFSETLPLYLLIIYLTLVYLSNMKACLLHFNINKFLIVRDSRRASLSSCLTLLFNIARIMMKISTNERPALYCSQPIGSSFAIGSQPLQDILQRRPIMTRSSRRQGAPVILCSQVSI